MALPSAVTYGLVSWTAVQAVGDGQDVDSTPDAVAVTGTVTFTPSVVELLDLTDNVSIYLAPVTCRLDNTGVLRDTQGRSGISLVATNSPVSPSGWTWRASFALNGGITKAPFSFSLVANSTVNLTSAAPVPNSLGSADLTTQVQTIVNAYLAARGLDLLRISTTLPTSPTTGMVWVNDS